ncbi:hypothetical protein Anas_04949, partial [Armadillidium nasatum]
MLNSQAEAAIKFLISIPKYEVCIKWLKSNSHCMGRYFVEGFTPHNQFDVLVHGDCCSNNLLFRYDKKDDPVDVIFVDLQSCRKSSPASDLIYFFYSSLDGDVRSKYFKQMTSLYYKSFSKVLHLAKKKIPFSFTELLEEIDKRKTFGLATGIFLLPAFLAEDEEIFDMENFSDDKLEEILKIFQKNFEIISERGPFKDRFLSIFDDMLEMAENNDNTPEKCYELVTDSLVKSALEKDKGEDAELISFEVKPFTKAGDNYLCVIAEVLIKYRLDDSEYDVSYVAKLNPLRPESSMDEVLEEMFGRETD